MNYLKLIGYSVNHEAGQDTATFRVVDAQGAPIEKAPPVGIALPRSVIDVSTLKPNGIFAIHFTEVDPVADV